MGWLVGSPLPSTPAPPAIKRSQVILELENREPRGKALWGLAVGRGECADLEPEAVWLWAGHLLWLGLC